ncbi:hypothetical protein [Williamsia sp. CHRR-6]|uniref:hypothetical protein n=1 Tax=Williamsia sp. CHRR-6 TaxID=2835871 RepID=UPI001BD970DF|nr:hypothetical protein [Williamsia sp. CHRR-6]MBT0566382.1 hypothetical protein [Williamsia sp. CHRR-6]
MTKHTMKSTIRVATVAIGVSVAAAGIAVPASAQPPGCSRMYDESCPPAAPGSPQEISDTAYAAGSVLYIVTLEMLYGDQWREVYLRTYGQKPPTTPAPTKPAPTQKKPAPTQPAPAPPAGGGGGGGEGRGGGGSAGGIDLPSGSYGGSGSDTSGTPTVIVGPLRPE